VITLKVNGEARELRRRSGDALLWALRDVLGLTEPSSVLRTGAVRCLHRPSRRGGRALLPSPPSGVPAGTR